MSSCQIQLYQVMCVRAGSAVKCSHTIPSISLRSSVQPAARNPHTHTNFCRATTRQKPVRLPLPVAAVRLLTTRGKQTPASIAALQRGMAASQAGGFQGLVFPLPEGQKLLPETLYPLCTLHETRLDRRRRSGRTNQVGLGLQLDGWMDGQPGREVVPL